MFTTELAAAVGVCANDEAVTSAVARKTASDNEAVLSVFVVRFFSERLTIVKLMKIRVVGSIQTEPLPNFSEPFAKYFQT